MAGSIASSHPPADGHGHSSGPGSPGPCEPSRSAGRSDAIGADSRADEIESEIAGLDGLATGALRIAWHGLYRARPPTRLSRDLLIRAIAYKLQERAHGGPSSMIAAPPAPSRRAAGKGQLGADSHPCLEARRPAGARMARSRSRRDRARRRVRLRRQPLSFAERDRPPDHRVASLGSDVLWTSV